MPRLTATVANTFAPTTFNCAAAMDSSKRQKTDDGGAETPAAAMADDQPSEQDLCAAAAILRRVQEEHFPPQEELLAACKSLRIPCDLMTGYDDVVELLAEYMLKASARLADGAPEEEEELDELDVEALQDEGEREREREGGSELRVIRFALARHAAVSAVQTASQLQPRSHRYQLTEADLEEMRLAGGLHEHAQTLLRARFMAPGTVQSWAAPIMAAPALFEQSDVSRFFWLGHGAKRTLEEIYGPAIVAELPPGWTPPQLVCGNTPATSPSIAALFADPLGGAILHLLLRSQGHFHTNVKGGGPKSDHALAVEISSAIYAFAHHTSKAWFQSDTVRGRAEWSSCRRLEDCTGTSDWSGSGVVAGNPAGIVQQLPDAIAELVLFRSAARADLVPAAAFVLEQAGGTTAGLSARAAQFVAAFHTLVEHETCGVEGCTRWRGHGGSHGLRNAVDAQAYMYENLAARDVERAKQSHAAEQQRLANQEAAAGQAAEGGPAPLSRGIDPRVAARYVELLAPVPKPCDRLKPHLREGAIVADDVVQLVGFNDPDGACVRVNSPRNFAARAERMYLRFKECNVDGALQAALLEHFDGDGSKAANYYMGAVVNTDGGSSKKKTGKPLYWHAVALGVALAESGVAPETVLGLPAP